MDAKLPMPLFEDGPVAFHDPIPHSVAYPKAAKLR
jgi:hypothetical protein